MTLCSFRKNDPLVDQVAILDGNPTYANIRYSKSRESAFSISDLAPSLMSKIINDINQDHHDNGTASFHKQDLLSSDATNQAITENDNAQEKIFDAFEVWHTATCCLNTFPVVKPYRHLLSRSSLSPQSQLYHAL